MKQDQYIYQIIYTKSYLVYFTLYQITLFIFFNYYNKLNVHIQLIIQKVNVEYRNYQQKTKIPYFRSGGSNTDHFHFNDVYNIQAKQTKVGGVLNFKAELQQRRNKFPTQKSVTLFSGDCLSPSLLSQVFRGKKMVEALNTLGIDCACFGNHEFDLQPAQTVERAKECNFDWLLGNIKYKNSGVLLGQGIPFKTIMRNDLKIGLFGIAGDDWLGILVEEYQGELEYTDYIQHSRKMVTLLRQQQKCDIIVALTHMRNPADQNLAKTVQGIDIILGGHEHVILQKLIHKIPVVKSGCEFKNFSVIRIYKQIQNSEADYKGVKYNFDIDMITVPFHSKIDKNLESMISEAMKGVAQHDTLLGYTDVPLQTRFAKIRAQETNYGNFIADLVRLYYNADVCFLNSGAVRNDKVIPRGPLKFSVVKQLFNDLLVVKSVPGHAILKVLERSCEALPHSLSGCFLLVSGLKYQFDCEKEPGKRVVNVQVGGEKLILDKFYLTSMKDYLSKGGDGFEMLRQWEYTIPLPLCIDTVTLIQRFFRASDIDKKETQQLMMNLNSTKSLDSLSSVKSLETPIVQIMRSYVQSEQSHDLKVKKKHDADSLLLGLKGIQGVINCFPTVIKRKSSVSKTYERINQLRKKVLVNGKGERFVCIGPKVDGRVKCVKCVKLAGTTSNDHNCVTKKAQSGHK